MIRSIILLSSISHVGIRVAERTLFRLGSVLDFRSSSAQERDHFPDEWDELEAEAMAWQVRWMCTGTCGENHGEHHG